MAAPKLGFINLAHGGSSALKEQNSTYPQNFSVPNRPEYGDLGVSLKVSGEWLGAMYGTKRSLDLLRGTENIADRLAPNGRVGLIAVPSYSYLFGLEVRVDSPMTDPTGVVTPNTAVEFRLASTQEVIALVPTDEIGSYYTRLDTLLTNPWVANHNDAIEMRLVAVPGAPVADDEYQCVPLPCLEDIGLCISVALNLINNAIEPRCQQDCPDNYIPQ